MWHFTKISDLNKSDHERQKWSKETKTDNTASKILVEYKYYIFKLNANIFILYIYIEYIMINI